MTIAQQLLQLLRTWHKMPAGELLQRLDVSRPTLMRAVAQLQGQVITRGRARRTAYAARREIRGDIRALPLFQIDTQGRSHEVAQLEPLYPQGCALSYTVPFDWPCDDDMRDGWFGGLPYPLDDMRPQGFLGRSFAQQFAGQLLVNTDLNRWSEDDVLHALSMLGWDQSGNYILGEPALRRFLEAQQQELSLLDDDQVAQVYPERAAQALHFGLAGSAAAGEFPKFTAHRALHGQATHVIVKFSGTASSPQEQRWSDLLVCEHLALQTVAGHLPLTAAQSRVFQHGGRTFYEVDRFDRHGEFGRSAVCSWAAVNGALLGVSGPWTAGAQALLMQDSITPEVAGQIQLLWHFGRLIANNDMHDGNLSFLPGVTLTMAPVYDMLPMLYAPQRGVELVAQTYAPLLPLPTERTLWLQAAQAATVFWQCAAADARISTGFRQICEDNAVTLERVLRQQRY